MQCNMCNTVSQTEAASMLSCLLPKVKRMLREGVLDQVSVPNSRYKRIPILELVKLLRNELQTITLRSSTIKNALMNMQTRLDAGEPETLRVYHDHNWLGNPLTRPSISIRKPL